MKSAKRFFSFHNRRHWKKSHSYKLNQKLLLLFLLFLFVVLFLIFLLYLTPENFPQQPQRIPADTYSLNQTALHETPYSLNEVYKEMCYTEYGRPSNDYLSSIQHVIRASMNRYDQIPSNGGSAGKEWSSATQLEGRPSDSKTVKARFLTVATDVNALTESAVVGAIMSGVPLTFLGIGWTHYSHLPRHGLAVSYLDAANLSDDDVVVMMDLDTIFVGDDFYPFISAFVASTAASKAEHQTYSTRDIRLGKRLPPFFVSAENNCMHRQVVPASECGHNYQVVEELMTRWADEASVTYLSPLRRNPIEYLNSGFIVARVWAFREVMRGFFEYAEENTPLDPDPVHGWNCDQSIFGTLYNHLRWWEVKSGALDGPPRHVTQEEVEASGLSTLPKLVGETGGPYDLQPGLIGIDMSGRLAAVVSVASRESYFFTLAGHLLTHNNSLAVFANEILPLWPMHSGTTIVGAARSSFSIEIIHRHFWDCVLQKLSPECDYRYAVLALPKDKATVSPAAVHVAGSLKQQIMNDFGPTISWMSPLMFRKVDIRTAVDILQSAPRNAVWKVNPLTEASMIPRLLPHDDGDDLSYWNICRAIKR